MRRLAVLLAVACVDHDPTDDAVDAVSWPTCADAPRATPETLAEKAVAYEALVGRLHLRPDLGWVMSVDLRPGVDVATATWRDVATWASDENDGLWSSLYLAAEAFRYAATHDAEALDRVRALVEGERVRAEITGVPGLFTRTMIPPGIDGLACPEDEDAYRATEPKSNRWLRVDDAGCLTYRDADSGAWTTSDVCPGEAYAGWCLRDNMSQDEAAGHVFALGVVDRLVDDPAVQATVDRLLGDLGRHLVAHRMRFTDWDGRPSGSGDLRPLTLGNFPGYQAAMGWAFLETAYAASGDATIRDFVDRCMLDPARHPECLGDDWPDLAFPDQLPNHGLYALGDCRMNFNDVSMHVLSLVDLAATLPDGPGRDAVTRTLDADLFRRDDDRALLAQKNAWFDLLWAATQPGEPALDAVDEAVCQLKQFPASLVQPARRAPEGTVEACTSRLGSPASATPFDVADRCPWHYTWWGDPYVIPGCDADPARVWAPTSYLLPYWFGRWQGMIAAAE